jgi:hypothetical protein
MGDVNNLFCAHFIRAILNAADALQEAEGAAVQAHADDLFKLAFDARMKLTDAVMELVKPKESN